MKKVSLYLFLTLFCLNLSLFAQGESIVVQFKKDVTISEIAKFCKEEKLEYISRVWNRKDTVDFVNVDEKDLMKKLSQIRKNKKVVLADEHVWVTLASSGSCKQRKAREKELYEKISRKTYTNWSDPKAYRARLLKVLPLTKELIALNPNEFKYWNLRLFYLSYVGSSKEYIECNEYILIKFKDYKDQYEIWKISRSGTFHLIKNKEFARGLEYLENTVKLDAKLKKSNLNNSEYVGFYLLIGLQDEKLKQKCFEKADKILKKSLTKGGNLYQLYINAGVSILRGMGYDEALLIANYLDIKFPGKKKDNQRFKKHMLRYKR